METDITIACGIFLSVWLLWEIAENHNLRVQLHIEKEINKDLTNRINDYGK